MNADELKKELQEYLDNTSPEELRKELDNRRHLQDVPDEIVDPSTLSKRNS